jgi:hypothetical protein
MRTFIALVVIVYLVCRRGASTDVLDEVEYWHGV